VNWLCFSPTLLRWVLWLSRSGYPEHTLGCGADEDHHCGGGRGVVEEGVAIGGLMKWVNRLGILLEFLSFWFAAPEILGEGAVEKTGARN